MSDRRDGTTPDRRQVVSRAGGRRAADPPEDIEALLARADVEVAIATRLLDVAVIARRLKVTDQTVRNWIAADLLVAVRTPGGHYRVPVSELSRILKSQTSQIPQI